MGYPASIVSWAEVATAARVLRASDIIEPITELEGIEAELGVNVHGEAGSLSERLSIALAEDGTLFGRVAMADATDAQIKRMRSGYFELTTLNGGTQFETFTGAANWVQLLNSTPLMFFCIHDLSTTAGRPAYITWGTTVGAGSSDIYIQALTANAVGIKFGVSWVAIESAFDSTNSGLYV